MSDNDNRLKVFINEYKKEYDDKTLSYYAGYICEDGDIANYQKGAEDTLSVGMPIYDEHGNTLGMLSIGLCDNLNYHTPDIDIKIPVYKRRVEGYKGKSQNIKTFYQHNTSKTS